MVVEGKKPGLNERTGYGLVLGKMAPVHGVRFLKPGTNVSAQSLELRAAIDADPSATKEETLQIVLSLVERQYADWDLLPVPDVLVLGMQVTPTEGDANEGQRLKVAMYYENEEDAQTAETAIDKRLKRYQSLSSTEPFCDSVATSRAGLLVVAECTGRT